MTLFVVDPMLLWYGKKLVSSGLLLHNIPVIDSGLGLEGHEKD